jgi:hypothetical protein
MRAADEGVAVMQHKLSQHEGGVLRLLFPVLEHLLPVSA